MSTHANMVKMGVTSVGADPYTITLGAAESGYQHINAAITANATVDILITMGTTWEVARNCTYTYSATPTSCTITRGTLESSSTGSRITTFDNTAVVSVVATAAFGNNAGLNHVAASPTDAGVTGVVGTMHLLDISGLTATRNFTLPATAAVGDRVGVYITTGDNLHSLVIIGDTGDTINGGAANTEWGRLYNTNEMVVLRCVTANTAWIVEHVKWIDNPFTVTANGSTTQTPARNTVTKLTTALATVVEDADALWSTSNKEMTARRGGLYLFAFAVQMSSIQDGKSCQSLVYKGGSGVAGGPYFAIGAAGGPVSVSSRHIRLATADVVDLRVYYDDASVDRLTDPSATNTYISGVRVGE